MLDRQFLLAGGFVHWPLVLASVVASSGGVWPEQLAATRFLWAYSGSNSTSAKTSAMGKLIERPASLSANAHLHLA